MRITGGHGHALGEEAAAVVRQAVSLAARRGHAQVTPLHIARAMLSASPAAAGIILRAACVRSQSHLLLHHNALDLRLDVALDRLPSAKVARTTASVAAAVINHREPAPSNAFVAALKRVQAHRGRRGAVGGGGDMVELEQLVVSVLDDPSVDRAMRAAGFSASQVRASIEGAAFSSEQSSRASRDVEPSPKKTRAGGQSALSLQIAPELHPPVIVVPDGSECQASKTKSRTGRSAFFGRTEVAGTTTAILPPWLRRYICTPYTGSTYRGTNLQAEAASRRPKFTELTAQNLKILCDALELRVPWHADMVDGISTTVLRCRSGVARRRAGSKPTTWLLFRGRDAGGKTAVARELARLVFGSYARFTTLQVKPGVPATLGLKRRRSPDDVGDVGARLFEAIVENPHRVILIEGVDGLDRDSGMRIKDAIAGGAMMGGCNGDVVVGLEDAIVVLSSDVCDSRSVVSGCSQRTKVRRRQNGEEGDAADIMEVTSRRGLSWDLNVCAVEEDGLADDEGILNVVDGVFLFN